MSSSPLQLGTTISLEISLPVVEPGTEGLQLRFDGVVVRSVESVEAGGFAVTGDFRPHMLAIDL